MEERGGREPRERARVLHRIPTPPAAPAQFLVGPDHPESQAEREEEPGKHRPAADGAEPRVVQVAGNQRRHAERKRNRQTHQPRVERRRMDHHVRVLQQWVEPAPIRRRLQQIGGERVVVQDHHAQEEHLHHGDGRDDVRDQLAVPLPVRVDGDRAENREQEDPEHDRSVQAAPVRRQLVEQRLNRVGVAVDVADRVIADDERADDDRRGERHERRDQVEGPDAALQEARVAPAVTRDGRGGSVRAGDEGGQERVGSECRHG